MCSSTNASSARPRSTCWWGTRPRRRSTLGWRRDVDFPTLVAMMVEADLALVKSQLV